MTGIEMEHVKDWYGKKGKPVSIVIPSYNDFELLQPLIASLKATVSARNEIIIVDDYCQAANRAKLKTLEDEQVKVIYRARNGGFAKAVNTGLKATNPKYDAVLVNSDIIAHENWLAALQFGAYQFGKKIGIVGPKLLYPDGRIQSAGSYRNTEAPQWFDHYYRFQDASYGPANIPHYCLAVTGACMYIKRAVIKDIGILDEDFQFAFEDVDLCLRAWEADYKTLYFPSGVLTHVESASRPKHKNLSPKEEQSISYFWKKWGDWFDKRNVRDRDGNIRIIFVLQTMGLSGGIKIVFEHAQRLAERGFKVEVWGLDHHGVPWEVADKVKLRTFKKYDAMTVALEPEQAIKVATWWETAFPVWLASIKNGIPVYFIQEFETWFYPNDVVAQATVVSCYRKEFTNLTTSQYNLEEIRNLGLKATAIPCGYDETTYKQLPAVERETNTLLAVGRRFFQKNFMFTFNAWKALKDQRPHMWLFGIEPDMRKMDKRITYFQKPSNAEVNELYNKATVFVQTSRHEGFSLPILEAMAAGCPVICTDAHGNRDFCVNGKNCLMVEHDDIPALTHAIQKVLNDPELSQGLANEALKTVKKYQWPAVIDRVEAFYKEVAK